MLSGPAINAATPVAPKGPKSIPQEELSEVYNSTRASNRTLVDSVDLERKNCHVPEVTSPLDLTSGEGDINLIGVLR